MKYENEITVEVDVDINELNNLLGRYGFKTKEKYEVKDIYLIEKDYIITDNYLDALKHTIVLRTIIDESNVINLVTYKYKEYNEREEIIKQGKIDLKVDSIDKAVELFEMIGYTKLINIDDYITVMANDVTELCIQMVNNKHIYIEMEDKCRYINHSYASINDMIEDLKKYNIPLKSDNYFVKKAEIELMETVGKE